MDFRDFFDLLFEPFRGILGTKGKKYFVAGILNSSRDLSLLPDQKTKPIPIQTILNWWRRDEERNTFRSTSHTYLFTPVLDGVRTEIFDERRFVEYLMILSETRGVAWQTIQSTFTEYFAKRSGEHVINLNAIDELDFYESLGKQCYSILCAPEDSGLHVQERFLSGGLDDEEGRGEGGIALEAHQTLPTFKSSPPARNALFTGREQEMSDLSTLMLQRKLVAVSGIGGLGKSEMLKRYYLEHHEEYDHHVFLSWHQESGNLAAWMELFCSAFDLPMIGYEEEKLEDRYARACTQYRQRMHGRKLLIVDALPPEYEEEVITELSRLDADVLLSSRRSVDLYFMPYQLDVMEQEEAVELFCTYANITPDSLTEEEYHSLQSIVHLSGHHPLMLELLARIHWREHTSLTNTKERIEEAGLNVSSIKIKTVWSGKDHNTLIENFALLLSLYHFVPGSPVVNILGVYSVLPTLPLPSDEVIAWMSWDAEYESKWSDLDDLALLKWDERHQAYTMHQVIAEAVREEFPLRWENGEIGNTLQRCFDIVAEHFYLEWNGDLNYRSTLTYYCECIANLLRHCSLESALSASLANRVGLLFDLHGDYNIALEWHLQAVSIAERVLGLQDTTTATLYNNVAVIYRHRAEYDIALLWLRKALDIREPFYGNQNNLTADSYLGQADAYRGQGDFAEAIETILEVIAIREKTLGDHIKTAKAYYVMGDILGDQGDYDAALVWYLKGISIDEKEYDPTNPDLAISYNNIGLICHYKGDYSEALEWHHKALAIREESLGEEDQDTATSFHNIANAHRVQGQFGKALEWFDKALAVRLSVLGYEDTDTADTLHDIALVYRGLKNYAKSIEFYRKAIKIKERILGIEHIGTAMSYYGIAIVYHAQENYPEALEWHHKALVILETERGFEHPLTALSYNAIGNVYHSLEEYSEAILWLQKALRIREKAFGVDHPDAEDVRDLIEDIQNMILDDLE